MMIRATLVAAALAFAASCPASAFADDEPAERPTGPRAAGPLAAPPSAAAARVDERLAFLEERIEIQRLHAQVWWETFITFYGIGVIVQSARAAEASEDRAEQADLVVSVVKAVGGVARYAFDPMKGIQGFDPVEGESSQARLARGERILRQNAEATTPFGPWYAHLINVAINGTGAVIVGAGFGDWRQGLISAGIGVAVGEISLFTQPWEADDDLEEYENRFGKTGSARRAPDVKWSIRPSGAGAAISASF